jgi:hypothetical protein
MVERWSEAGKRGDGLSIVGGLDGWVIMPHAEGLPIDKCPCCDKPFARDDRGLRAAKLVADALFPMEETGNAD